MAYMIGEQSKIAHCIYMDGVDLLETWDGWDLMNVHLQFALVTRLDGLKEINLSVR